MKLSITESEYQKALFVGGLKSLKINYSSKFYVIKVVESKFEVLKSQEYSYDLVPTCSNFV